MRSEKQKTLLELQKIPNVGPATAHDLIRLGITSLADLKDRNPDALFEELCSLDGSRHDPCTRDIFEAIVAIANGQPARPWWMYSSKRKKKPPTQAS